MNTDKKLQVGDVVYSTYISGISSKDYITRVTEKQAFVGSNKFKREVPESGVLVEIGDNRLYGCRYKVETPELIEKWERKLMLDKLQVMNFERLTTAQLRQIKAILDQKPEQ